MIRKISSIALGVLVLAGSVVWGAQPNFQQIRRDNNEMRKSIVWLTEGLNGLSKSKDKALLLQPAQKKKILPIFQALVKEKILTLSMERPRQSNGPDTNRGNNPGNSANGQGQRWGMDPNDPKVQERLKQMQSQTAFGNKQAGRIDAVLTKKQVAFIDNLDFNGEKYGFLEFRSSMGGAPNSGQGQGGQGQFQRPDPQTMAKIRGQMQAGRQNLVKLCQNVEKMLKSK